MAKNKSEKRKKRRDTRLPFKATLSIGAALTNKVFAWIRGVERIVDEADDPIKKPGVERLGGGRNGKRHLILVLTLLHVILSHLETDEDDDISSLVFSLCCATCFGSPNQITTDQFFDRIESFHFFFEKFKDI